MATTTEESTTATPPEEAPTPLRDDNHEHAMEFSNYDVLLAPQKEGCNWELDQQQQHVGNNRFVVMLNMHKQEFDDRLMAGESTAAVVSKIIDIVCRQCIPTGRFLQSEKHGGKDSWMVLTEEEAQSFVTDYLMSPAASSRTMSHPETLTNSMPVRRVKAAAATPPLRATVSGPNSANEDKKRRRRSSLLRRSISETGYGDKKKSGRFNAGVARLTNWLPKLSKPKVQDLDIIFNGKMEALIEGQTGNNRLMVMLDMQRRAYQGADEEEKTKIVSELMSTVTGLYKGRFLAENPEGGGDFLELQEEQITTALRGLLDAPSTSMVPPAPTPIAPSIADGTKRPSLVKNLTLEALHRIKPSKQAQDMRSAAVASLQKRKHRQGLTHKIRNLTAGTRPNNTAGPGLSRASSEPVVATHAPEVPPTTFASAQSDIPTTTTSMNYERPASEFKDNNAMLPTVRDSMFSQMSDGAIEDLLQGLDVSESDMLPHNAKQV